MKITAFRIENFRGIALAEASGLGPAIVIAGQNGSGKSCLFDAIRLLKSVYGGYQQNEWQQWMNEFTINIGSPTQDLTPIFNDKTKPVEIRLTLELHKQETDYLTTHAVELLTEATWKTKIPEAYSYGGSRMAIFASQFRDLQPEVNARVQEILPKFLAELENRFLSANLTIPPSGMMLIRESSVLPVIFSIYRPRSYGSLEHHSAQRNYAREQIQSLNISIEQRVADGGNKSLYNQSSKYSNIKSEMASSYVRELLAQEAGIPKASQSNLTNSLKELFSIFFPDKEFLGPIPQQNGSLIFPVRTSAGNEHDLDELSSGEKEILYGYLRLRNLAPSFSIIFIDEPELHLNPRLIRGLPQFYRAKLGIELDNQIWLVSHSDALLREAVGNDDFQVFHMQAAKRAPLMSSALLADSNQLKQLIIDTDLELALIDIVGDLAAYRPDKDAVIFEGGGDADFDQWMTATIFPEYADRFNFISGSNKHKVRALHEVLENAREKGKIRTKFFGIVDGDNDYKSEKSGLTQLTWPAYHIENFLLDAAVIAPISSSMSKNKMSPVDVEAELKACAREVIGKLVTARISSYVGGELIGSLKIGANPQLPKIASAVFDAARKSLERANAQIEDKLSLDRLSALEENIRGDIDQSFENGDWKKMIPGREILKSYAGKLHRGVKYETFRNMIVNRMADLNIRPLGMTEVLKKLD